MTEAETRQSRWLTGEVDLRTYWDQGLPISEIAAKMRMTEAAIAGRARKLNLPSRPRCVASIAQHNGHMFHREGADLTGLRIGKRTVTHRLPSSGFLLRAIWNVRCDCGRENSVFAKALIRRKPPQTCRTCWQIKDGQNVRPVGFVGKTKVKSVVIPRTYDDPPAWLPPSARASDIKPIISRSLTCQWIISMDRPVTKCGEPVVRGKPYCADHGLICVSSKVGTLRIAGYAPAASDH